MAEVEANYTHNLRRNLTIGLVTSYAATVGMMYAALRDLDTSAAIAVVPALFAGPYIGIMLTVIGATKASELLTASAGSSAPPT